MAQSGEAVNKKSGSAFTHRSKPSRRSKAREKSCITSTPNKKGDTHCRLSPRDRKGTRSAAAPHIPRGSGTGSHSCARWPSWSASHWGRSGWWSRWWSSASSCPCASRRWEGCSPGSECCSAGWCSGWSPHLRSHCSSEGYLDRSTTQTQLNTFLTHNTNTAKHFSNTQHKHS